MTSRRCVRSIALVGIAALTLTVVGCGRSSSRNGGGSAGGTGQPATKASSAATGDFGTLKNICGPGNAKGATGRGVTNTDIRIGTTADPGAAAAPGLEEEFFDVGDAFTKWCNAAGGINGRKIVLDKWDAKLFNVGAAIIRACQNDFMLVGNGNAFDSAAVKPRLACKLGQIPAYVVSPEAATAPLQVQSLPQKATQYQIGGIRLLTEAYPESKTGGVGVGSSNLASLLPQGKRIKEGLIQLGVKVTTVQEKPPLVDNFRPYMEELKNDGTVGLDEISGVSATPEIQAMHDVGWKPQFVLFSSQFYTPQTVQAAKATPFPPTYVSLQQLPWELSDKFPVLAQAKRIVKAAVANPRFTTFTSLAFNAWTLWAQSATACGSTLTQDCVLKKAGAHTDWTAGGMFPPVNTDPANPQTSKCAIMIRLTPDGWVYDKKVTNPDMDLYNCNPKNIAIVKTYQ